VKRRFRLNRESDIKRVRRFGKSTAHPLFALIACSNQSTITRTGIICSRSLGNAVKRNRARRRLRASVDSLFERVHPGWDILLVAKKPVIDVPFSELTGSMLNIFSEAGLIDTNDTSDSFAK
jgi:ribonuclease P protein component